MKKVIFIALVLITFGFMLHAEEEFVGDYRSHQVDGNKTVVDCLPAIVSIEFCTEDIVKIALSFIWDPVEDSSFIVIPSSWSDVNFTIEDNDSSLQIVSNTFDISCEKYPFRLSFYHRSGSLLLQERSDGGLGWENPNQFVYFAQTPDDHFYGLGMRAISLDRKGRSFDTYNRHGSGDYEHSTMGINIPFLCTTSGYGLYFDNTYPGVFDFGEESPEYWFYRTDGGQMVYYLIYGPDMYQILKKYTWLTGRQPLPPRWALGLLQSKYGYWDENEARNMIATMRTKGIPCDAIILDLYWFGTPGDMGRFAWELSRWPDPAGMMKDFREQGIKTILIEEPYFTTSTANFTEASSEGYFGKYTTGGTYVVGMWAGFAGLLDFSNPAARDWWWSKHEPFLDQGVAGWWTDLGEPEEHPDDMYHYIGSAAKVHNILNLLWSKTLYDGYRSSSPDERVFIVTRSGYAGMQRYGTAPWSGDVYCSFRGLRNQIPIMLGMSLSGVGYQHSDIGGFAGTPTGELYARWMQFGTFCPITRPHGVNHPTEPWGYGPTVEAVCKKYITLRYRLLPYVYTMAYINAMKGIPLARPLVMEYPDDDEVLNLESEYLWGDDFLVAPVTDAGATTKMVYLPEGEWIDYWTKNSFTQGYHEVPAPLDVLPLFVKAGAIIPLGPKIDYSDQMPLDTLTLDVYPSGFSSSFLYEDDGQSYAYESGDWDTTRFTCQAEPSKITLSLGSAQGSYSGRLANRVYICQINRIFNPPDSVLAEEERLTRYFSLDDFASATEGWFYDSTLSMINVKIETSPDIYYQIDVLGYGFTPECEGMRGDPTGDGVINVLDIVVVVNHILCNEFLEGDAVCRGDCTGEDTIDVIDALTIANVIVGIIPECPGEGMCKPEVTQETMNLLKSLETYLTNGDFTEFMSLVERKMKAPSVYCLAQNYPNPFNPTTSIRYSMISDHSAHHTTLRIYNLLGHKVRTLVDKPQETGYYSVVWDGRDELGNDVASGIYFYSLHAGKFRDTKKMILVR